MSIEAALLQEVIENPDAEAPRLAYADLLEASGHAERAHFVRAICEVARYPEGSDHHRRLTDTARQLFAKRGPEWLGPRLTEFVADNCPDPVQLRKWARHHSALPLTPDMGGCFCLRLDGEVISFIWDREEETRVERETRLRNRVLAVGSKKYPELRLFIPPRPVDAGECPSCEGKGVLMKLRADVREKVVCECGGLGWITASSKHPVR
jgi:uncharacterized protein (TIGR02996 family)